MKINKCPKCNWEDVNIWTGKWFYCEKCKDYIPIEKANEMKETLKEK